jgi:iron complex transport system ATP-binding protein
VTTAPAAQSGPEAAAALAHALADVGELLSYLKADIGPVAVTRPGSGVDEIADGMWLSCHDLIADPEWLARVIEGTGRAIGTTDQMVAGSIFIQGYAYRLLALAVSCLTVAGVVPGSAPEAMAIGLGRGRASRVAYVDPSVFDVSAGREGAEALSDPVVADRGLTVIVEQVVEGHLRPLIAATKDQVRIGERLLWGNVAASASTAFRTMEGSLGAWVIPLGRRFFELAGPELQGLGSYFLIEKEGKRGWFWERTNCCLFYQIEGHGKCSDCSLTPAPERRAAYEATLDPPE